MYTSVALIALSTVVSVLERREPIWNTDYTVAKKVGSQQKKPLAVVVASGTAGWQKLSLQGSISDKASQTLAEQYVCVYLDMNKRDDRVLAEAFDLAQGPSGLILSDRSGTLQAFRHQGQLSNGLLESQLSHFAEPNLVVRATETATPVAVVQPVIQPAMYSQPVYAAPFAPGYGGFSGFGGGFGGGRGGC